MIATTAETPLIPQGLEIVLQVAGVLVLALVVVAVITLLRSPLEPQRRLIWVLAIFVLPLIGPAVWLWWRYWYYPHRRDEEPDWDPNDRTKRVNLARKSFRDLQRTADD